MSASSNKPFTITSDDRTFMATLENVHRQPYPEYRTSNPYLRSKHTTRFGLPGTITRGDETILNDTRVALFRLDSEVLTPGTDLTSLSSNGTRSLDLEVLEKLTVEQYNLVTSKLSGGLLDVHQLRFDEAGETDQGPRTVIASMSVDGQTHLIKVRAEVKICSLEDATKNSVNGPPKVVVTF